MKRILWIVLSVVLLAGMGFSIIRLVTGPSPTVPRPADVAVAARVVNPPGSPGAALDFRVGPPPGSPAVFVGGNGVVEPAGQEIRVASEVAGRVARVLVEEGERVSAGQVLIELSQEAEAAAVEVAEAEVAAAEARRDAVVSGTRDEDVRAAAAEARAAGARAALAREVAARTEALAAAGAATADELERAKRQAEADGFAARAADARRARAVNGSRAEDVAAAEAEVRIARARAAEAKARLAQRVIVAPAAGEILRVLVRPGEHVEPGGESPVVMGDTSHLMVRVDVDERDLARVSVGATVSVTAKAFGERTFSGRVQELGRRMGRKNVRTDDPTERNDTKILEVVVALDDAAGLVVGQRVTAMISAPEPSAGR